MLEKREHVIVRINRGNHDGHSSYALALMVSCYFHSEPRIEVDLSPATMWYCRFAKELIGSTHGDTNKGVDLIPVMAADRPADWGATAHRCCYVGHVHHQDVKKCRGGVVEYFRTLAAGGALGMRGRDTAPAATCASLSCIGRTARSSGIAVMLQC